MRHIYQHCKSDCYPTCVAMIASISHSKAIKMVHPFHKKGGEYYTTNSRAIKVLRLLGFKVKKRKIKSFTKLKHVAILNLTHEDGDHVAVWDPDLKDVLEPSRGPKLPLSWYKQKLNYVFIVTR